MSAIRMIHWLWVVGGGAVFLAGVQVTRQRLGIAALLYLIGSLFTALGVVFAVRSLLRPPVDLSLRFGNELPFDDTDYDQMHNWYVPPSLSARVPPPQQGAIVLLKKVEVRSTGRNTALNARVLVTSTSPGILAVQQRIPFELDWFSKPGAKRRDLASGEFDYVVLQSVKVESQYSSAGPFYTDPSYEIDLSAFAEGMKSPRKVRVKYDIDLRGHGHIEQL